MLASTLSLSRIFVGDRIGGSDALFPLARRRFLVDGHNGDARRGRLRHVHRWFEYHRMPRTAII